MVLAVAAMGLLGTRVQAQAPKRSFDGNTKNLVATIEPATAKRGQTVTFRLSFDVNPGFHTYPLTQPEADAMPFVTAISFNDKSAKGAVVPVGAFTEPPVETVPNPVPDAKGTLNEVVGKAVWERKLVIRPDADPGTRTIKIKTDLQVCDKSGCLPGPKFFDVPLTISNDPPETVDPKYGADVTKALGAPAVKPPTPPEAPKETPKDKSEPKRSSTDPVPPSANSEEYRAGLERLLNQLEAFAAPKTSTGLMAFILSGIFWGGVSLITPCVFPMIPITVSFFLKQSEKEHHRPITMAIVYCSTIVVVLTLAAVVLLSFFRELSVMPITNFILGGLFIFFALSLFGMYEIELPSFMTRYTSSREGQGGLAGTMFMALTFTLVSFSCVAPFLGGFGGTSATATMSWAQRVLGGLAFSLTFASPFFILALFPTLLKKMPKSGSWLNTVKVVMGFLEVAAAIKFFRAGEVSRPTPPEFFTYDVSLGLFIALSLCCGLYLLGLFRLPHDTPSEHLSVPRMVLSMLFLGLAIYLVPALFSGRDGEKQRPSGTIYAWIDSFLLPAESKSLEWAGDLNQVVAEVRKQRQETGDRQLIFVDFTGTNCTNCKYNESTVFTRGDIKERLKQYKRVQLYTNVVPLDLYPPGLRENVESDDRPRDDASANLWFQKAAFNTEQLPLYVILDPQPDKVKVVGVYDEGKINDVSAFGSFIGKPLEKRTPGTQQAKAD
jgi:thiol:disulfide interchange protein DsbD